MSERPETRMTRTGKLLCFVAAIGLVACSATGRRPAEPAAAEISVDMLLGASPLVARAGFEDLSDQDTLEVTSDMAAFLDRWVDDTLTEQSRLKSLLRSIIDEDRFELVYDDKTRTASETFRDRRGNCLSFTNMFVAMARYLELDARFQEVDIPPDWSTAGHALLLSEHVNVFIDLSQYTDRVVDFNTEVVHFYIHDLEPTYSRRVISDERARAHYFNNVGVELMLLGGDHIAALNYFQQSLHDDPSFSPAWISLGILYRREGYFSYAEAAFLQALETDPYNLVAMSNLASLYELTGKSEKSEYYKSEVKTHRLQNPYFRFELAREAFVNGNYDEAIDHLHAAIRRQDHESEFYSLLSLSYMMTGDSRSARRWMQQAEETASVESEKQKYRRKLDFMKQYEGNN
ncbi:MAG: tetratricopeptide repeat protein [Chromatiales bacterium]|jgi:Flp pilus assembly protein TadD